MIAAFCQCFVKPGFIEVEYRDIYGRIMDNRRGADYEVNLLKQGGDSHAYSDIDVLLIVDEESWPLRQEISTLAARVSLDYNVLIAPRVIGQKRWDEMGRYRFMLYQNIKAEGVELFSA